VLQHREEIVDAVRRLERIAADEGRRHDLPDQGEIAAIGIQVHLGESLASGFCDRHGQAPEWG
jgi:hypothetical protein